jgi:hypothetical protein
LYLTHTFAANLYFVEACRKIFATDEGIYLQDVSTATETHINEQVSKLLGVERTTTRILDDLSIVRNLPDDILTETLLLALIGNFTTGAADAWNQPCHIVMSARTGLLALRDKRDSTRVILVILVLIFCIILLRQVLQKQLLKEK